MIARPLGNTGLHVSVLGLGTVKLGRNRGVKYPAPFELPSDDQARALITAALDLGITLFDTAPAYGRSEERLGHLLAGVRDRVVLATKAGEEFDDRGSRFDFSAPAIRLSVERSLQRLRTDHADIVLLHSDGVVELDAARDDAMAELRRLKTEGKIRAVGISTKTLAGALWAVGEARSGNAAAPCDVVMLTINPHEYTDAPAAALAAARGIGVLVKKALASGHLDHVSPEANSNPAAHALSFALATPGVSSVVVGTASPEHLRDNVRAARQTG